MISSRVYKFVFKLDAYRIRKDFVEVEALNPDL
jgi:hypothetical protein